MSSVSEIIFGSIWESKKLSLLIAANCSHEFKIHAVEMMGIYCKIYDVNDDDTLLCPLKRIEHA